MTYIAAITAFLLGATTHCIKTECKAQADTNSHIVKTEDYVPGYERDWRERYAV